MAITKNIQPTTPISAYRHIQFKVTSDDANIKRMQGFIYVDGTIINPNSPVILDPDIDQTDEFTFDLQEIIQDQLSFDLQTVQATGEIDAPNSLARVRMKWTELILSGGVLVDGASLDSLASDDRFTIQAALKYEDLITEVSNFDLDGSTKKFLTNYPRGRNKLIQRGDSEFLSCLITGSPSDPEMRVQTFDFDGNDIDTDNVNIPSATTDDRFDLGVGVKQVNSFTAISIDSDVDTYSVRVDDNGSAISETFNFRVDRRVYISPVRFHWLNRLGGFDSFTFRGNKSDSLNINSNEYEKVLQGGYAVKDRKMTELQIELFEKFQSWTDMLPDEEIIWLQELYTSPQVYIEENANLIPVIVLNKDGWGLDRRNDSTPQLMIEYIKIQTEIQRN